MQRREFLGALGVGAFAAAPLLTIDPGLDPAEAVARVRATGAASIRIGNAFNDYKPVQYKSAWLRIRAALQRDGLGNVRMEWAFRPTGELVPFMDWHPGVASGVDWKLAAARDDASTRSFLAEMGRQRPA
jgi:hypothetical protein